jgi:hypothetical protein
VGVIWWAGRVLMDVKPEVIGLNWKGGLATIW